MRILISFLALFWLMPAHALILNVEITPADGFVTVGQEVTMVNGGFSAMSPPGPIAPGTIWNVAVNVPALTVDPESLDFAFPTWPTRNYVRRSSDRKGATTLTWIGVNGKDEAIIHAEDGVVSGFIFNGTRHFELEAVKNGTRFEWVDQTKVGEPSLRLPTSGAPLAITLPKFEAPKGNRAREASVDVLFIYTQQAFTAVGGGFGGGLAKPRPLS